MLSYSSDMEFQICPSLDHAGLVLINSLLETIPGKLPHWRLLLVSYCPLQKLVECLHSFLTLLLMFLLLLVRSEVDSYIGIDYSLLKDPVITDNSLDMDFRVTAFLLSCFRFVTNLKQKAC